MLTINVSKRAALLLVLGALLMIPVGAWASHEFSDVPTTNFHHDNISWLSGRGITQGCGDGTTYCPKDPVTREQMATFMRRLSTSRAVDSGSVDGLQAADINRASYNQSNDVANLKNGAVLSTTIIAPRPGILITGGSVQHLYAAATGFDGVSCDLKGFNPEQAGATDFGVPNDLTIPASNTASCVVTGASVVQAGTWTVTLNVRQLGADTTNGAAHVWAQFVPFDGTGTPVLP